MDTGECTREVTGAIRAVTTAGIAGTMGIVTPAAGVHPAIEATPTSAAGTVTATAAIRDTGATTDIEGGGVPAGAVTAGAPPIGLTTGGSLSVTHTDTMIRGGIGRATPTTIPFTIHIMDRIPTPTTARTITRQAVPRS